MLIHLLPMFFPVVLGVDITNLNDGTQIKEERSLNAGIVGIIIGVVAMLALVFFNIVCCCCSRYRVHWKLDKETRRLANTNSATLPQWTTVNAAAAKQHKNSLVGKETLKETTLFLDPTPTFHSAI